MSYRIEEEIERLQKHQKELLEEWKNSCNTTLKWIADTFARMQAQDIKAEDLDHARAQRQELEVRINVLRLGYQIFSVPWFMVCPFSFLRQLLQLATSVA